jgi:hypothetical protein
MTGQRTAQSFGKRAEKFILDYFNNFSKDIYITRFADTYDANRGRWGNPNQKKVIITRRPSDAIMVCGGITSFVEIKCTENKTGIIPTLFSEQTAERTRIKAAGGRYVYFIYSRFLKTWYAIETEELAENGFKLSWEQLKEMGAELRVPPVPDNFTREREIR